LNENKNKFKYKKLKLVCSIGYLIDMNLFDTDRVNLKRIRADEFPSSSYINVFITPNSVGYNLDMNLQLDIKFIKIHITYKNIL